MRSFRTLTTVATWATWPALGLLALGASGCAAASPDDGEDLALGEVTSMIRECPEDVCGSNSPNVESQGFHELSLVGLPNPQQMKITSVRLGVAAAQLKVEAAQLVALVPSGGRRTFPERRTGHDLVGLRISLEATVKDKLQSFELEVMRFRRLPYPVPLGSADSTGAYVIEYTDSDGARRNLCRPEDGGAPDLPYDEAFGQQVDEAIFFEGDRIDTETMTIDPVVDATWFNVGCSGHTLAKLHLTRNTTASRAAAHGHLLGDRQATLKMFVADYCGNGTAFTVAGQPLSWRDSQRVMDFFGQPTTLEARWTAGGAACLGEPRMLYPVDEDAAARFPDIMSSIRAECPALLKKRCTNTDPYDFVGAPRVSANRVF